MLYVLKCFIKFVLSEAILSEKIQELIKSCQAFEANDRVINIYSKNLIDIVSISID